MTPIPIDYLDRQIHLHDFIVYTTGSSSTVSLTLAQVADIHTWQELPVKGWRSTRHGTFKRSDTIHPQDEPARLELRVWKDRYRQFDPNKDNLYGCNPEGKTRSVKHLERVIVVPRPPWVAEIQNAGRGIN